MGDARYERIDCDRSSVPSIADPAVRRMLDLLLEWAGGFASRCRTEPGHPSDSERISRLLCAVGLGVDEAGGFLRALDHGLVTVHPDGNFRVPGARACSPNLHLVGREGDRVKLHTEVLIHVTAYAELVLDQGWEPDRLVFDPFFENDALDLWGFAKSTTGGSWRDGDIVFAAEAKSRVKGGDGLTALVRAFDRLASDPDAQVATGHRRKWEELERITHDRPIQLLLVADSARWWFEAKCAGGALTLSPA